MRQKRGQKEGDGATWKFGKQRVYVYVFGRFVCKKLALHVVGPADPLVTAMSGPTTKMRTSTQSGLFGVKLNDVMARPTQKSIPTVLRDLFVHLQRTGMPSRALTRHLAWLIFVAIVMYIMSRC